LLPNPTETLATPATVAWQIVIHVCLRESRAGELRPSRLPGIEVDVSRTFPGFDINQI